MIKEASFVGGLSGYTTCAISVLADQYDGMPVTLGREALFGQTRLVRG